MIGPLSFLPLEDAQEKGRGLGTAAEQEASGGGSTLGGVSGSLPYVREQGHVRWPYYEIITAVMTGQGFKRNSFSFI